MSGYTEARSMLGLHEIRDRDTIKKYLEKWSVNGDISIDPSRTAWCAAIMNAWERSVGNKGTGLLNARSFCTYGKPVQNLADAQPGDIVVFSRGGQVWLGHVAYFDGVEKTADGRELVRTVGGNQSDTVSVGWYPSSRLRNIRRP